MYAHKKTNHQQISAIASPLACAIHPSNQLYFVSPLGTSHRTNTLQRMIPQQGNQLPSTTSWTASSTTLLSHSSDDKSRKENKGWEVQIHSPSSSSNTNPAYYQQMWESLGEMMPSASPTQPQMIHSMGQISQPPVLNLLGGNISADGTLSSSSRYPVSSSQDLQGSNCALRRWIMAQCNDNETTNSPPTMMEDGETIVSTSTMTLSPSAPLQFDLEPVSVPSSCVTMEYFNDRVTTVSAASCDSSTDPGYSSSDCSLEQGSRQVRFRKDQAEQWSDRYDELVDFYKTHGHCRVPRNLKKFSPLASWVKRQRYQYKLRNEGKPSFLTDERVAVLDKLGFVWDSHHSAWDQRFEELRTFAQQYGHVNVPYNYSNAQLASWVKAQRREFKGFRNGTKTGKSSQILMHRFSLLESLDFCWELRSPVPSENCLDNNNIPSRHLPQDQGQFLFFTPNLG